MAVSRPRSRPGLWLSEKRPPQTPHPRQERLSVAHLSLSQKPEETIPQEVRARQRSVPGELPHPPQKGALGQLWLPREGVPNPALRGSLSVRGS